MRFGRKSIYKDLLIKQVGGGRIINFVHGEKSLWSSKGISFVDQIIQLINKYYWKGNEQKYDSLLMTEGYSELLQANPVIGSVSAAIQKRISNTDTSKVMQEETPFWFYTENN